MYSRPWVLARHQTLFSKLDQHMQPKAPVTRDPSDLSAEFSVEAEPAVIFLKEQVCDVRDPYSMTIHKSQGSTYQFSLTDLGNLRECRARDTQRRLKYVGGSRASEMFIGCL